MRTRVDAIATLFEHFGPQDVAGLGAWYAEEADFKDPFNDVRGLPAIQRVYAHMFEALEQPRFAVHHRIGDARQAWLAWEFTFGPPGRRREVRGSSHLLFDDQGLIALHRDYWDPAEELYEHAPVLGTVLRWIKRRLAAPQA